MKKFLLAILGVAGFTAMHAQVQVPPTELHYNVHYHWGLVNVMIAHGTVNMETDGTKFSASLDGNSIPWEGRVFCVSDTLKADMTPGTPLSKETVTYENGWYLKPKTMQFRSAGFNPDDPANYKNIKGRGELSASEDTMEAITVTADMLGMFYYFKELDFESMSPGQQTVIPIYVQGGSPEKVVVTYNGKSSYNASGTTYPTYSCQFEYSYHGEMSGYPVKTEVARTERIPVLLSASLPIGHVEMIYAD